MLTAEKEMKRAILTPIFVTLALAGFAQQTVLEKAWTTSSSMEGLQEVDARINKVVTSVGKHHYRNDQHRLYALFKKTHTTFLYQYNQYSNIDELTTGKYDCLTATALFADVLSRAGYNYNIIETNYHIFIVVNTSEGEVILETTDRFGGFINDKTKINNAIARYRMNTLESATPSHHQYKFSLYQAVDPDQLNGLLYFNQAVRAFNEGDWTRCSEKLAAAAMNSKSPRIAELSALLNQQASNK